MEYIQKVVEEIINSNDVIKATKYLSPKQIIRAVRQTYKVYNRKPRKVGNVQITLTIGKPNYAERDFIKLCQEANEPFPISKIQLKRYNPDNKKIKGKK